MNRVRCAIYTRKSSEDGLEQDFNSLDAQHEACEAYVASQRHEGWELLPDHYDDGGISGGRLERPALQRLMDQVTGISNTQEKQRTWRIPARQLEEPIADAVQQRIRDLRAISADQVLRDTEEHLIGPKQAFDVIDQVQIKAGELSVHLNLERIQLCTSTEQDVSSEDLIIVVPFAERRRGVEMKLTIEGTRTVDQRLLCNIAKANHWYKRIKEGATFDEVACEVGTSKRRIQQMIHLAFLAPDIVRQITLGKQPMGLTSDWLLRHGLPSDWDAQRKRIAAL